MKLFKHKSHTQELDEMVTYGFELAIKYAELAKQYDKPVIPYMKEQLARMKRGAQ